MMAGGGQHEARRRGETPVARDEGTQLVGEEDIDELGPEVVPFFVPDVNPFAGSVRESKDLARVGPFGALAGNAERPARRALVRARNDDDLDCVSLG
jgi:hypothetical protein